jgi:hypothetical protein
MGYSKLSSVLWHTFKGVVDWLKENYIPLLQIDPSYAEKCKNDFNLTSADIGWHGKCSIQYEVNGTHTYFSTE